MIKKGILFLACPLHKWQDNYYFSEIAHVQLTQLCQTIVSPLQIIARARPYQNSIDQLLPALNDVKCSLALQLPDFGDVPPAKWKNLSQLIFSSQLNQTLANLISTHEFIYVEGPSLEAYLVARIARRLGRYLILEVRGDTILNPIYMSNRFGIVGYFYTYLLRYFFAQVRQQTKAALYVSPLLMEQYPISTGFQQAISDARLPSELFLPPRHFTAPIKNFLYIGHLEKIKRVDLILEALAHIHPQLPPQWKLHLVGQGPEQASLEYLAQQRGLTAHVQFHGRVPWGPQIFALYQQADLLLMASTSEGASRTLLEGMATALPVLSTAVGTAPFLLPPDCLTPVGDKLAYAQNLLNLVYAPRRLTEISQLVVQQIQAYQWDKLQQARQDFFTQALHFNPKN